jgi:hypothetical protein
LSAVGFGANSPNKLYPTIDPGTGHVSLQPGQYKINLGPGKPRPKIMTAEEMARNPQGGSAVAALGPGLTNTNINARQLDTSQIAPARATEQDTRGQATDLTGQLQQGAAGTLPSAAQIQSRQALAAQGLAQMRAANDIRGGAPAIMAGQRAAATGLAGLTPMAAAAGGQARSAELNQAQAVLANHLLATRGTDIRQGVLDAQVAARNADLTQQAQVANQANSEKVGEANLTQETGAAGLDIGSKLHQDVNDQTFGLQSQEAKDARALGLAGLGLGEGQVGLSANTAGNNAYLGKLGLDLTGKALRNNQSIANLGLDTNFWSGVLNGAAAPIALAAIPGAPAAPAQPATYQPPPSPGLGYQPYQPPPTGGFMNPATSASGY